MKFLNWLFGKKEESVLVLDRQSYELERLELDRELFEYECKMRTKIIELAKEGAEEIGRYEHYWHADKEARGIEAAEYKARLNIEIAELEAKRDNLQNEFAVKEESFNERLSAKDFEIARLKGIIDDLIGKFPRVEVLNKVAA